MKKINILKISAMMLIASVAGIYMACQPDEFGDGNGLTDPEFAASFTVTKAEGKTNTWIVKSSKKGVLAVKWDKGTGKYLAGSEIDTVVFPDAGTYTVGLQAVGKGGITTTATQDIVVDTSDPVAGNLVVGGRMDNPDAWTKLPINGGAMNFDITDGELHITGGSWGHNAVYQPIEVVAGRKYKLDLFVEGSGATDVWFEVYLGTSAPTPNNDYSDGGIRLGLNTWTGCAKTPFEGQLSSIGCTGSLIGSGKTVTFDQSGTIYLLIKCGGADAGTTGISVDNVEFRGVK